MISFLTIGIIWINHHAAFSRLRVVDHSILMWNLALLLTVSVLPFTTSLMAAYLKADSGEGLAAAVYAGSLLLMGVGLRRHQPPHPLQPPRLAEGAAERRRRRGAPSTSRRSASSPTCSP